jgi:hypothetical protein
MLMSRFMADSVDGPALVSRYVNVPGEGGRIISLTAGYANGHYHATSQADGPTDVQIDVNGSAPGADVLDIENGDATPLQAASWVHAHNASGYTHYPAILYVNRSNIHTVANVLAVANLQVDRDYKWWISTLDGTKAVPDMTGVVAVQAWNAGSFAPRNIDLSIVYDDSWKPGNVGSLPIPKDDNMFTFTLPAAPDGSRHALTLPVSRACEVTLSCDGSAVLTEYGWVSPEGGNGFQETNVTLPDQGAHSFQAPKGTGKVDIQYHSDSEINGVVDIIG